MFPREFPLGLKLKFVMCGQVQDLTRRSAKNGSLPGQTVYFTTHKHPQMFSTSSLTLYFFSNYHLIKYRQNIVSLNLVNEIICSVFEVVLCLETMEQMTFYAIVSKEQTQIGFASKIHFRNINTDRRRVWSLYYVFKLL